MSRQKTRAFFLLVEEMRKTQKEYFRTRDKTALEKSKELERKVDKEIDRTNKIQQRQLELNFMKDPFGREKL